jgi:acyl dehydratase
MRRAIGLASQPVTHEIEKGHIKRFAEAIGDGNPLYQDEAAAQGSRHKGITAPPTFFRALNAAPLPVSPFQFGRLRPGFDAGSEWEYHHPVKAGDRITVTAAVEGFETKAGKNGDLVFVSIRTTYTNQRGETVATQKSDSVLLG